MTRLLYQITNKLNGKYYIGAHEGRPDDNYMGSGRAIRAAIRKHGRENFQKDVLAEVCSLKFLYDLESAVVDEIFVSQPDTYNLCVGGSKPPAIKGNKHSLGKRNNAGKHWTLSKETRAKMSLAKVGNKYSPGWPKGKHRKELSCG